MAIIGPGQWIGQVGDYHMADYQGERPSAQGVIGQPNYLLHSYCCCGRSKIGECCTEWFEAVEQHPGGFMTEWDIPVPNCFNAILPQAGIGVQDWDETLVVCPNGVQITVKVDCRPSENDATKSVYWLRIGCLGSEGSDQWEGEATSSICPPSFAPGDPPFVPNDRYGVPVQALWGPIPGSVLCDGAQQDFTLGGQLFAVKT